MQLACDVELRERLERCAVVEKERPFGARAACFPGGAVGTRQQGLRRHAGLGHHCYPRVGRQMKHAAAGGERLAQSGAHPCHAGTDGVAVRGLDRQRQTGIAQLAQIGAWQSVGRAAACGQTKQRRVHDLLGDLCIDELCDVGDAIHIDDGDRDWLLAQRGERDRFAKATQEAAPIEPRCAPLIGQIERLGRRGAQHLADHADRPVRSLRTDARIVVSVALLKTGLHRRTLRDRLAGQLLQQCGQRLGPDALQALAGTVLRGPEAAHPLTGAEAEDDAVAAHEQQQFRQRFDQGIGGHRVTHGVVESGRTSCRILRSGAPKFLDASPARPHSGPAFPPARLLPPAAPLLRPWAVTAMCLLAHIALGYLC